jgi:hypothetical protein
MSELEHSQKLSSRRILADEGTSVRQSSDERDAFPGSFVP